ncbi:helix-hairpin-helix domain-containing protein [Shewanella insulae]|uniref:Helix-hairpin-helix domain-containing protein n=1 Tax=Shewanella insulae TaxID=2681496 RepID=A0A6L7HVT1_9GAMM|nr:helix-hairpin-helix domain-containing protein [Shewanella insulae]MCG9714335.1 helix-hairpin-helix domain-containing protein [Shewanella insulae]MCG9737293.1 helix-hairpin-helix domain-containing protein [Shewanella insulae]MCG9756632.1 helix-hairpin-helix domain-containing protein [Shewanella insulae]MXR68426.1 helix-hairpin-helix domain-containing protein [Shewanella insulae]
MKNLVLAALVAASFSLVPALAAEQVSIPADTAQASLTQVNINTATAQELTKLKGIGDVKASAIVEYRDAHGKFNTIEELTKVKGIGPKVLEQNKTMLSL